MADYYPLIARAVEGLADRSAATRQAVYERARAALTEQLRGLDPPLSEAELRQEQEALDEAIARVEADHTASAAAIPHPQQDHAAFGDFGEPAAAEPPPAPRPRVGTRSPLVGSGGGPRTVLLGMILAVVIAAIAVTAWFLRDTPGPEAATEQVPPVAQAPQARPQEGVKLNERVGGGPPLSAPGRSDVTVAQRAVLYLENTANPQTPITQAGRVVWRLEGVNAGQGQPLDSAVRAVVDFPDAGLSMTMLMRRNLDATLPASHTVELSFTPQPGDPGREVREIGLLQLKDEEAARGTPVAGLRVTVKPNVFLIGLSNLSSDVERNIDLLLRRNWIDLPLRLASGQRAILSFEKGQAGEQVLNEAFRNWQ